MHSESKLYFMINRCNVTLEKTMICKIVDNIQFVCLDKTFKYISGSLNAFIVTSEVSGDTDGL